MSLASKLSLFGLCLLLLNSAYLFGRGEPTLFYLANVLAHVALGLVLIVPFSAYVRRAFRQMGVLGRSSCLLMGLGGASGLTLMLTGATTPYRWLLQLHIIAAVSGALFLIAYLLTSEILPRRIAGPVGVAIVALLSLVVITGGWRRSHFDTAYLVQNPPSPPMSMEEEGSGPDGPFFPASVETASGKLIPTDFFLTSETCGEQGCHPDIYRQWEQSAHHFSSFNNQWYRKSVLYMQEVVGTEPSKWCGGCHDPAILLDGRMDEPIADQLETPAAQAGLACTACHSIERVKDTMGNSGFVIEYPPLHELAASENPLLRRLHNYLIRLDPEPHRRSFLKPFHRQNSPEFCSTCHKVHLDKPVNDYRWFRGFNDYDDWQMSGVSHQGALSFYYPEYPLDCADCHMPLTPSQDAANIEGYVHNHRFPAANTALPFVNHHKEQLQQVTEFLKANRVTVDIFALSHADPIESKSETPGGLRVLSMSGEGDNLGVGLGRTTGSVTDVSELVAPLDRVAAGVRRGGEVRVDVVVRTRNIGHRFPAGTIDAFDIWLELKATDEQGRVIFWSGRIEAEDGDGPVDEGAHFYRSYMLDEHGNHINKRNAWAARAVLYSRRIPPGAADTVHYRLSIPEDSGDTLRLHAKLNYRKFNWWHTQWAYAGERDPDQGDYAVDSGFDDGSWVFTGDTSQVAGEIKAIPNLPIVVMAEDEVQLQILDATDSSPVGSANTEPRDRERWNDYGIGLLLQGDLKGAEAVFLKVTEIDPEYMDGWVNVARCRLQEGDIGGAERALQKAFELQKQLPSDSPHRAKVHYFYALTQTAYGHYEEALEHLRQAEMQFPRDRRILNEIGRVLFRQRRYTEAVAAFQRTLAIDPEDLDSHYNLMLCYRALGDMEKAQREQTLYRRFKADESAQSITGIVRRANLEGNLERQRIREHRSAVISQEANYE